MAVATPAPVALSLATLVLVNALPLIGVAAFGWTTFEVLALYWAENVIIGVLNVARMGALLVVRREWAVIFLAPFFALHYGMFCAGHGFFLFGMFGSTDLWADPYNSLTALARGPLLWPLLALAASHGLSFVVNFLWRGEVYRTEANELMAAPYARIVLLHLTIIFGAIAVAATGNHVAALVLLVALKTIVDGFAHLRERRRLGKGQTETQEKPA